MALLMHDALLLPLDDRPCNALFPIQLAEIGGFSVKAPPRTWLGNAQQPARLSALQRWFESRLDSVSHLFLSLDTWLYGGLISSRKIRVDTEILQARLDCLSLWKQQFPQLKIHVFATLMRISDSYDATEEKPYWDQYGREIYAYSCLSHKSQITAEFQAEAEQLRAAIPEQVLVDYQTQRQQHFDALVSCLALRANGYVDSLFIGCDDGAEFGWNVLEKQALQHLVQDKALDDVLIYPGADELACALLARVLVPEPLNLRVQFSYPEAQKLATRYEGIPLQATLAAQAEAVGCVFISASEEETGPLLWLHNPPGPQYDQFLERAVDKSSEQVIERLMQTVAGGHSVALADIYYANGGDKHLLDALETQQKIFYLQAYAGWNTVGNTLGLILAWLKFKTRGERAAAHWRFFLERVLDDGFYQGYLRQKQCAHYTEPVTMSHCLESLAFANDKLQQWQDLLPLPTQTLEVEILTYPWQRFFEIELALRLIPQNLE